LITVISENKVVTTDDASVHNDELWLSDAVLERVLDDTQKQAINASHQRDDKTNVTAMWRAAGRTLVSDQSRQAWVLGASATERSEALLSLQAPDFTLADPQGNPHSLSDYRGQKVFLTTWSSW
jgi:hypothetical protein